jgi:hypothetical protein
MQFRYDDVKTFMVLCEDKLEERFWLEMFEAAKEGQVTWKKSTKTVYEESPTKDKQAHSRFIVVRIQRD